MSQVTSDENKMHIKNINLNELPKKCCINFEEHDISGAQETSHCLKTLSLLRSYKEDLNLSKLLTRK